MLRESIDHFTVVYKMAFSMAAKSKKIQALSTLSKEVATAKKIWEESKTTCKKA